MVYARAVAPCWWLGLFGWWVGSRTPASPPIVGTDGPTTTVPRWIDNRISRLIQLTHSRYVGQIQPILDRRSGHVSDISFLTHPIPPAPYPTTHFSPDRTVQTIFRIYPRAWNILYHIKITWHSMTWPLDHAVWHDIPWPITWSSWY